MREPTEDEIRIATKKIAHRITLLTHHGRRGLSDSLYEKIEQLLTECTTKHRQRGIDFPKLVRLTVNGQIYILRADRDRKQIAVHAYNIKKEHPTVPYGAIVAEVARAYQIKPGMI